MKVHDCVVAELPVKCQCTHCWFFLKTKHTQCVTLWLRKQFIRSVIEQGSWRLMREADRTANQHLVWLPGEHEAKQSCGFPQVWCRRKLLKRAQGCTFAQSQGQTRAALGGVLRGPTFYRAQNKTLITVGSLSICRRLPPSTLPPSPWRHGRSFFTERRFLWSCRLLTGSKRVFSRL